MKIQHTKITLSTIRFYICHTFQRTDIMLTLCKHTDSYKSDLKQPQMRYWKSKPLTKYLSNTNNFCKHFYTVFLTKNHLLLNQIVQSIHKCLINNPFSKVQSAIIYWFLCTHSYAVGCWVYYIHNVPFVTFYSYTLSAHSSKIHIAELFITIHIDSSYKGIIRNTSVGISSCHMFQIVQ